MENIAKWQRLYSFFLFILIIRKNKSPVTGDYVYDALVLAREYLFPETFGDGCVPAAAAQGFHGRVSRESLVDSL